MTAENTHDFSEEAVVKTFSTRWAIMRPILGDSLWRASEEKIRLAKKKLISMYRKVLAGQYQHSDERRETLVKWFEEGDGKFLDTMLRELNRTPCSLDQMEQEFRKKFFSPPSVPPVPTSPPMLTEEQEKIQISQAMVAKLAEPLGDEDLMAIGAAFTLWEIETMKPGVGGSMVSQAFLNWLKNNDPRVTKESAERLVGLLRERAGTRFIEQMDGDIPF